MSEPVLRLNSSALAWSAEDGEVVALDLSAVRYVGVNRAGTLLWTRLGAGATQSDLVSALVTEYGIDAEQAGADVESFLRTCRQRGYLE